jgi:hypothetical protein
MSLGVRRMGKARPRAAGGLGRRGGALADNMSMCPHLNSKNSKFFNKSAQSFEYESFGVKST